MKKILLLLTLINTSAFGADVRIENKDAGSDIVFRQKNSVGTMVETMRVSPPLGDGARSVGAVGSIANSQGGLAAADFTSPTNAHWYTLTDLNDGTTGTAKPLTNVGTVPFNQVGFFGRESIASFDGSTQSLTSADAIFNVGNVAFSYGGWFNIPSVTSNQGLISRWVGSTGYMILSLGSGTGTNVYAGGTQATLGNLPKGEWVHVVVTYNPTGTISTMYVNGQKFGSLVATNTTSTAPFRVGGQGTTLADPYRGQAQDAFFALETLTDAQVLAMYSHRFTNTAQIAAGHVLAASSFPLASLTNKVAFYNLTNLTDGTGGASLTNTGTTLFSGLGLFGAADAAVFNGSSQYLSTSNTITQGSSGPYYISGWFAANDWTPSAFQVMAARYNAGADRTFQLELMNGVTPTQITFEMYNQGESVTVSLNATGLNFVDGSWHHIAAGYDGFSTVRVWIDGVLAASGPLTGTLQTTTVAATIGSRNGSQFYAGRASNFAFIRTAMTDADIRKLYSSKTTHSKNIAAQNQNWFSSWMREDSKLALPLENGWMTDMNANALFTDFSDLNPGDYVTIKAK